jgi:hypothetical protein
LPPPSGAAGLRGLCGGVGAMLLFCPGCGNGLIVEEGQRCHRFACNTCPYVHNITRKVGPGIAPPLRLVTFCGAANSALSLQKYPWFGLCSPGAVTLGRSQPSLGSPRALPPWAPCCVLGYVRDSDHSDLVKATSAGAGRAGPLPTRSPSRAACTVGFSGRPGQKREGH